MSNKITRQWLFRKIDFDKDGNIAEVPIPEIIKATGIIPEGYTVGEW